MRWNQRAEGVKAGDLLELGLGTLGVVVLVESVLRRYRAGLSRFVARASLPLSAV